jgi:hypothetical protein
MLGFKSVHDIVRVDDLLAGELPLLMGAGPVPLADSVARANTLMINHLGSTMDTVLEQVMQMGAYLFQSSDATILGVAGPASAGLEMAVSNLVTPATRVLSVCNGHFGMRIAEMAARAGGEVVRLTTPPFHAAAADDVARELRRGRYGVLTICHGETSHTVHNTALPEICRIARAQGCLVLVDAVCTLGAMPFQMADWHIDAAVVGGQKALGAIPGVALVAFSPRAWARIEARRRTGVSTLGSQRISGCGVPITIRRRCRGSSHFMKRCGCIVRKHRTSVSCGTGVALMRCRPACAHSASRSRSSQACACRQCLACVCRTVSMRVRCANR